MANQSDFQVEGATAFVSPSTATYRYAISLKREKVNFWLEERSSKKQWQTGFLNKKDNVTAANIFVDFSAAGYVSCFKQCLDCPIESNGEVQRKLVLLKDENLQLELSLKIRLLRSVRVICYAFEFQPVAVSRIDILESKLRDQQVELEKLRNGCDTGKNLFLYVESETWISSELQWKEVSSENFSLDAAKTAITILVPGLYAFGVVVNHIPTSGGCTGLISLRKNGIEIQSAATGTVYDRNKKEMGAITTTAGRTTAIALTRPALRLCASFKSKG